MGTRGLLGYRLDKKFNGTYNHYDSYPSGLGEEVVEFCKRVKDWKKFKENLAKVKFVKQSKKATKKEIEQNKKWADTNVATKQLTDLYVLLRDLQGATQLDAIEAGEVTILIQSASFIKDSLFCEYAYVLNLDDMILEFYEGFQVDPRSVTEGDKKYLPCKLVGSCPIDNIPDDWEKQYYPG